MKLIILIGNAAVGKMTVGQELMKLTGLRLFHNHMMIEPVIEIFGYYDGDTTIRLREVIFESFAKSSNEGLIFTYMWAFDQPTDWEYIRHVTEIFENQGAEVCYVELITSQEVRLMRNRTENRLKNKASKRDLQQSRQRLLKDDRSYRCVSIEGEIPFKNYLRIDNTHLSPEETAKKICERFGLLLTSPQAK